MSGENGEVSVEKLPSDVAEFYDQISAAWEQDRMEHLHVGFYDVPSPRDNLLDDKAAAVRMVEEAFKFAAISEEESKWPRRVLDVGCGFGGSSRYLSRKYGAHVEGITISELQVERATALTAAEGLSDKVSFQLANALDQPFPDGQFDLFMQELARVVAPGGLIIMTTCCHRDLLKGETSLQPSEQELLDNIGRACCLPAWCSTADYVKMAQATEYQNCRLIRKCTSFFLDNNRQTNSDSPASCIQGYERCKSYSSMAGRLQTGTSKICSYHCSEACRKIFQNRTISKIKLFQTFVLIV